MDAQWVGVTLTAATVLVSVVVLIRSGLAQLRGEIQALAQQTREDIQTLAKRTHDDIEALAKRTREDIEALAKRTHDDIEALAKRTREDIEALAKRTHDDIGQIREDIQCLATQHREDYGRLSAKVAETAERTARIEGVLILHLDTARQAKASQATPRELEQRFETLLQPTTADQGVSPEPE